MVVVEERGASVGPGVSAGGKSADDGLFRTHRATSAWIGTVSIRLLLLISLVGGWELVGTFTEWELWISQPSAVWEQLLAWHRAGILWDGLVSTLWATLLGFVLGSAVGGIAGLLLGSMRRIGELLEPFVLAAYSIPKIALAPLFVLWFGIDLLPKVMLAAILVGFLVFFSVYQGFKTIDQQLMAITRVMGAGHYMTLRKVALPYSSAWMFTGLKMGLPYALIGVVVGEFMAATSGLGYMIKNASALFNTDGVFAGLAVLMLVSTFLSSGLAVVEKRVLHWSGRGI